MCKKFLVYIISIAITVFCSWLTLNLSYPYSSEIIYAVLSLIVSVFIFGSLWGYRICTIHFCISADPNNLISNRNIKYTDNLSSVLMRFCVIWSIGCMFTLIVGKGSEIQSIISLIIFVIHFFNEDKFTQSISAYNTFKGLVKEATKAKYSDEYYDYLR